MVKYLIENMMIEYCAPFLANLYLFACEYKWVEYMESTILLHDYYYPHCYYYIATYRQSNSFILYFGCFRAHYWTLSQLPVNVCVCVWVGVCVCPCVYSGGLWRNEDGVRLRAGGLAVPR